MPELGSWKFPLGPTFVPLGNAAPQKNLILLQVLFTSQISFAGLNRLTSQPANLTELRIFLVLLNPKSAIAS